MLRSGDRVRPPHDLAPAAFSDDLDAEGFGGRNMQRHFLSVEDALGPGVAFEQGCLPRQDEQAGE
jgi:hypothetical protein